MINVIPKPVYAKERLGEFFITGQTKAFVDVYSSFALDYFNLVVKANCKFEISKVEDIKQADIIFYYKPNLEDEEYIIDCNTDSLKISFATPAGALYAVQSLKQLTRVEVLKDSSRLSMHAVYIEDKPQNVWRGLMLDESRWFFGPTVVKDLLDLMSSLKLNVFHWHLTDNEGWRIEIKKYPNLTKVGSSRRGTQNVAWGKPNEVDNIVHEGFYTQEEIVDIVKYAADRNIMVVPEIDIPAHFAAAIASYPHLSCFDREIEVSVKHSENNEIIACGGKDSTYQFIYDVIDELAEIFPAPYFHIGGDEAPKSEWAKCDYCQAKMKENNLKDEEELQGHLNNKIAAYLRRKNKNLIGWNEILKAEDLDKSIIAQYWTLAKDDRVNEHLRKGGKVIISKHQAFYFDMPYGQNNLKTTYNYDHEKYGVNESIGILGFECTVWTEWINNTERLQFQILPRLQAFSEVAWLPKEKRDYIDFRRRLENYLPILRARGKVFCSLDMLDFSRRHAIKASYIFVKKDAHYEYKKTHIQRRKSLQ